MIGTAEIIKLFSKDDREKTNSEENFKVRLSDRSSKQYKQESNILPKNEEIYTKDISRKI